MDQELAGLIMWVAGGIVWTIEIGAIFIAWFYREERWEEQERVASTFQSAYPIIAGWNGIDPQHWPVQYQLASGLAGRRPASESVPRIPGDVWTSWPLMATNRRFSSGRCRFGPSRRQSRDACKRP